MLKKVSLRWRMALLSGLLMAVCCIGLSVVLKFSAYQMADSIDAITVQPAQTLPENGEIENFSVRMEPNAVAAAVPAEVVRRAKNSYLADSLLYTVTAVLIGGCLTYYVSGKALQPVKTLNEQVRNINTHNLTESLEIPSARDEIAELTKSFNNMTDKLGEAFAAQKRFSADAAHELRTPLAVLQTKLDVFQKKGGHTPEEYEALTAAFRKQIRRLRSLVAQLLDIANMDDDFERTNVDLKGLMEEILTELTPTARGKNVVLSAKCAGCQADGNPVLLYRAFYNLVENAVRYNNPGGNVAVRCHMDAEGRIAVAVCDDGIGIPEELKGLIFEPFYRVDKSRSRQLGGAGLGLSMVDRIVKKHGGTITVSDREERGTCFVVTLPPAGGKGIRNAYNKESYQTIS